ncbi:MAG: hypothetical protein JKY69_04480, partial [Flavobacteriaceae bacterium]|nr:hypothetical protein [Flavobacteriaceae bacterium]
TPSIEIYERKKNYKSVAKYDKRKIITKFVIETLKSELKKDLHFDVPLMSKDYLSVNKVLENIIYHKFIKPELIMKVPEEILIDTKKYTLLISLTGGSRNSEYGVLYFTIINNSDKIFESANRFNFIGSSLDTVLLKNIIKQEVKKLISK